MEKYIKLVLKAIVKKFMPCSHNPVFIFLKKEYFFLRISLPSTCIRWNDHRRQNFSKTLSRSEFFLQTLFERIDRKRHPRSQGLFLLATGKGVWEDRGNEVVRKKENLENFTATLVKKVDKQQGYSHFRSRKSKKKTEVKKKNLRSSALDFVV